MELAPVMKSAKEAAENSVIRTTGKRFRYEPGRSELKKEFVINHLRGELSAAERILHVADSGEITNADDLKAALHVFCCEVHNEIVDVHGNGSKIGVEHYTSKYVH